MNSNSNIFQKKDAKEILCEALNMPRSYCKNPFRSQSPEFAEIRLSLELNITHKSKIFPVYLEEQKRKKLVSDFGFLPLGVTYNNELTKFVVHISMLGGMFIEKGVLEQVFQQLASFSTGKD